MIEADQFDGSTESAVYLWNKYPHDIRLALTPDDFFLGYLMINTKEGTMTAIARDWIIKGVKDEVYPCKDDIFKMTYEEVKDEAI